MFIRTQPGVFARPTQPAAATLCEAAIGRHQVILTNLSATVFYIRMGDDAADGTEGVGGTFDFILDANPLAVVLDNYTGVLTCDPIPNAGDINVSELFGSNYRKTR